MRAVRPLLPLKAGALRTLATQVHGTAARAALSGLARLVFGWCLLLGGSAQAFDGNDALRVTVVGGDVVEGWYVSAVDGLLVLSGNNQFYEVPLPAIQTIVRDGELLDPLTVQAELASAQATMDAFRADPPPHPHPAAVIGASMLFAGAGHAMVGEWKPVAGYAAVELVLLGTAAWNVRNRTYAVLVPLGLLEMVVRGYSASEAAAITRSRRRKLSLE